MKTKYDIKKVLEFYRQCNEFFNINDGLYPTSTSDEIMDGVVEHLSTVESDRILTEFHVWEVGRLLGRQKLSDSEVIGGIDFSSTIDMLDNLTI